jgi:pSer/pThr/pTyr-binding forkhead associated (FHA) protein
MSTEKPQLIIGRGEGCDFRVEDEYASPRHAVVTEVSAGRCTIADLGSTNGTWLSGRRIYGPTALPILSTVQIGRTSIPAARILGAMASKSALGVALGRGGTVELKFGEEWTDITEHVASDPTAHLPGMFEDARAYCLARFSYPPKVYVDDESRERHIDNDARSTATDRDFAMPWNAGYARGVAAGAKEVADRIAYKIRAELVCCDIYDQTKPLRDAGGPMYPDLFNAIGDHDLCYWGEAAARIAEGITEKDNADG